MNVYNMCVFRNTFFPYQYTEGNVIDTHKLHFIVKKHIHRALEFIVNFVFIDSIIDIKPKAWVSIGFGVKFSFDSFDF